MRFEIFHFVGKTKNLAQVFACACLCTCATFSGIASAGENAPETPAQSNNSQTKDDVVQMDLFTVTGKTRGIVPIPVFVRYRLIGQRIRGPGYIYPTSHPVYKAEMKKCGIEEGERVISIDGVKFEGLNFARGRELWCEGEPGRKVVLLVQGSGEKESVFRKITVTTISIARIKKLEAEAQAASQSPTAADETE